MAWNESDHPRNKDGEFTDGNDSGKKGYDSRTDTPVSRAAKKIEEKKKRFKISLDFFAEKGLKNQSPKELSKGIKSLKKKIEIHNKKISNPRAYCKDWDSMSRIRQEGLIEYWRKETINHKNGIEERKKLLEELGENADEDD